MKKIYFVAIAALSLIPFASKAKNTYPWPTSGNIGIGTVTPVGTFQVKQSSYDLLTSLYSLDIGLGGTSAGWARAFRVVNSSNSNGQDGGAFGVVGSGTAPNYIYISIPTSDPTGYNSQKILALNNSGNVGIGTTSPIGKFDVRGNAFIGTTDLAIGSAGSFVQIDQGASTGNTYTQIRAYSNGGTVTNNLVLQNSGGKVGIGTNNPDQLLSVKGTIHSQEVKVDMLNWADYVFKPTYKLPSLSELKTFIDKNQHLPDMPSEKDVAKDGVSLGEMNKLLVKKVEELTLYLIQKDQAEKEQEKVNRQIIKAMESLKKEINAFKNSKRPGQHSVSNK